MAETTRLLTNKLGEESWVPVQIGNLLRNDNMQSVVNSYDALSSGVKMRILLSMLHLDRKRIEELEEYFIQLIDLALTDSDPWVKVTADILRFFPRNYQLNRNLQNFKNVTKIISELVNITSETNSR